MIVLVHIWEDTLMATHNNLYKMKLYDNVRLCVIIMLRFIGFG